MNLSLPFGMKCGMKKIMKKMRKILQKIAWRTHRWSLKIGLFNVYLGGDHNKFGFQILNVDNGLFWSGSLFEITWAFPTVTHGGELTIDILYLFEKWDSWCHDMDERELWGSKLNRWEKFNIYINDKLNSIR